MMADGPGIHLESKNGFKRLPWKAKGKDYTDNTCSLMHKTTYPCGGTKNDVVSAPIPSLPPYHHDPRRQNHPTPTFMVTAVTATSSWLRHRRIRYLFLLICSPVLLLLLCAALPFICAAELCSHCRLWGKFVRDSGDDDRLRRCEEGYCGCDGGYEEVGLLQRYLEDQLVLVRSMYECGDDEEEQYEFKRVEADVENLGTCRTPLLA